MTTAPKQSIMWQWYHVELNDVILIESWKVENVEAMVFSCLVVVAAGFVLEYLKFARWAALEKVELDGERSTKYGGMVVASNRKNPRFWSSHLIQTVYHFWCTLLSFILMNVFMTFNIFICSSVCLGLTLGYLVFARNR